MFKTSIINTNIDRKCHFKNKEKEFTPPIDTSNNACYIEKHKATRNQLTAIRKEDNYDTYKLTQQLNSKQQSADCPYDNS